MRQANILKQKINDGKPVIGMWVGLPCPSIAEMASHVGYDFIIIDNEHGQMTLETTIDMMRAADGGSASSMVRVPGKDPDFFKRILDAGANSLMVPMVDTPEQAKAVVEACHYPPRGWRGFAAPAVRGSRYGLDSDYVDWAHEELFLCLQIESKLAVSNAEAIAAIDGVDMLFIGASDLSGSLGALGDTAHPDVLDAMDTVKRAAGSSGKPLGTIPRPGTSTAGLAQDGFLLGAGAVDIMLLRDAAVLDIEAFRKVNG